MVDIVFRESFDRYSNFSDAATGVVSRWTPYDNSDTGSYVRLATGRFSGQSLERNGGLVSARGLSAPLDAEVSEFTHGFAFKVNSAPGGLAALFRMRDAGGTWHGGLGLNPDGSLQFLRSSNFGSYTAVGAASPPGTIAPGSWYYYEVEYVHSDSGQGRVYLNGSDTAVLSETGIDLRNSGNATLSQLVVLAGSGGGAVLGHVDDIYVTNAATGGRLGPQRFVTLFPTSDVSNTGFTPSTGSTIFEVLDDSVYSTTDYATASNVADEVVLGLTDLTATPQSISEVNLIVSGYATDAGVRAIKSALVSGASAAESADIYLPSSRGQLEKRSRIDPNTGVAWTRAGIDAMKARLKVTV